MRGQQETSIQALKEITLSGIRDQLRERCLEIITDMYTSGSAPIIFELTEEYKKRFPGHDHVYANDLSKRVSELLAEGFIIYGKKRRSPRSEKLCFEIVPTGGDRKMVVEARITTLQREIKNAEKLLEAKYNEMEALHEEVGTEYNGKLTAPQQVRSLVSLINSMENVEYNEAVKQIV